MEMFDAQPAPVRIDVGNDLTALDPGDELDRQMALFAHGIIAGFHKTQYGAAHR